MVAAAIPLPVGPPLYQLLGLAFQVPASLELSSDALDNPVISPAPDTFTITSKTETCQWDKTAKKIVFEGLGNCTLTVTANKQGFPEKMQDFTVNIFGRFTSITWAFPNSATNGGSSVLVDPIADPVAESLEIAKKSGDCEWDAVLKKLTFRSEKCIMTVTAKKTGYETLIKEFSVDPSLLGITVTKGTYGSVLADGVAVAAPTLTLDPTDATKAYTSTTPHICTVDPNTGAVTGKQAGNCGIELTLSKTGYNDNTQTYTVVVQGIFSSIVWDAFPSSAVQGTPTAALSSPVSSPPADTYAISVKSGDCAWDDTTDILSFSGVTPCVLTVTADKTGYQSKAKDFSVTAVGVISATAGSYGEAIYLGEAATPSPLTGLDPSDADAAYVSADEAICTVDEDTGAVTAVKAGECRVTLTLSKTGYNDKVIEYVTPVTLLPLNDFKGKYLFKGLFLGLSVKPAFADLDGDGDLDLVMGVRSGALKYYRRNATDAPTLFTELTGTDNPFHGVNIGTYPSPTFADIDGDSDLDLIMGSSDGTLKYFINKSANNLIVFTQKTGDENPLKNIDVGTYSTPAFADINKDNKIDLLVGEVNGTLKYFLNESANGTITFTAKTAASENPFNGIDVGLNSYPVFTDVNGDRKKDLVVGRSAQELNYYLNESTDSAIVFTPKTNTENPFDGLSMGGNSAPVFFDINGDNKLDLILGEGEGNLNFYLNQSTESTIVFTNKTENNNPFRNFNLGSNTYPVLAFATLDGDDKPDLVVGKLDGTLNYYLNESASDSIVFTKKMSTHNPFNGIDVGSKAVPTFVDIDGDSDFDMVVGESGGTIKYYLNESTSSIVFTPKTGNENPFSSFDVGTYAVPAFAHINGDSKIDLVVGKGDGTFNYFLNESTTESIVFTSKTGNDNPFNGFNVGSYATPTFADIDEDGDYDLLVGANDESLNYYLNESTVSSITFTKKTGSENPFSNAFWVGMGESNMAPTFVDIDGDDDLDVVVGNNTGKIISSY